MDLLEKLYEGEINFKDCVKAKDFEEDLDFLTFSDNINKLANSLKDEKQIFLLNSLESLYKKRTEYLKKQIFLNGLSYGMKMGLEMNNRFKDFNSNKNSPYEYHTD